MAALPARNILDGTATPTTSTMKTALGNLRDYLSGLLGDDGTDATALAALGAAASGANADIVSWRGGALAGLRNRIINGNFGVNQRTYVSGAAVGTGLYGHDRWKMAASADTYTFSTTANVTTVTIPASKVLQQVIEGVNLESGTYTLSWTGTAQGKIGAGSYGASGITGVIVGGTNTTIEFGPGTVSKVQLEVGSTATVFEQRPVGMELALCQAYYQVLGVGWRGQVTSGATSGESTYNFTVTMRVAPSVSGNTTTASSFPAGAVGFADVTKYSLRALIVANATSTDGVWRATVTASAEL